MYHQIASGPAREFEIILGLVEGYAADETAHFSTEVIAAIEEWVKIRVADGDATLSALVIPGHIVYRICEPCVVVCGQASPVNQADLTDKAFRGAACDLAKWLGERFNQRRVYVTVIGEVCVLEHDA